MLALQVRPGLNVLRTASAPAGMASTGSGAIVVLKVITVIPDVDLATVIQMVHCLVQLTLDCVIATLMVNALAR